MTNIGTQMEFKFTEKVADTFFVNTHLGKIPTSRLGITLVHEHVFNKFPHTKKSVSDTFTIEQLHALQKHNVGTIVDLTPYTSLDHYSRVLETTDINIVCCIGFYLSKYIPHSYKTAKVDELVNWLSKKIIDGRGRDHIYPGIFKVAGQNSYMTPLEERLFTTVGILQREHNLPIATHSPKGALLHIKHLIKAGADPEHIFCSHVDKGLSDKSLFENRRIEATQILDTGAYILFSEFGNGNHPISKASMSVVDLICNLKESGYIKQLLISADSNWRWKNGQIRLRGAQWDGLPRTYEYVFTQIIPVLKSVGFTGLDINTMLVDNPKKLFEF